MRPARLALSEQAVTEGVACRRKPLHTNGVSEAWEAELRMLWQRLRPSTGAAGRGGSPSLRTVAARSGYSVGFLSEVLRGRKRPSPDAAAAIATALGGAETD